MVDESGEWLAWRRLGIDIGYAITYLKSMASAQSVGIFLGVRLRCVGDKAIKRRQTELLAPLVFCSGWSSAWPPTQLGSSRSPRSIAQLVPVSTGTSSMTKLCAIIACCE